MFCLAAVLRSDRKDFLSILDSLANPAASCGVSARCCGSALEVKYYVFPARNGIFDRLKCSRKAGFRYAQLATEPLSLVRKPG